MNIIYNIAWLVLFQFHFASNDQLQQASSSLPATQKQETKKTKTANIIFKSVDGGQTWQDISDGLPETLEPDDIRRDDFFANHNKLFLRVDNGIYQSEVNSATPSWKKELFPDEHSSIVPGNSGIFAFNWNGQFFQRINGADVWLPVYTNFKAKDISTIFETAGGSVLIGTDNGLFKSTDKGESWKQVYNRGWVLKLVEANGVLMATSQRGIIKSIDEGENWECVLNEGGVGIAVEQIKGGFAAIIANTKLMARTVRISYDKGKTWQPIDAGLPAELSTASIIQAGEYFFCGHPAGIFRSADKGNTWKLILPSIDNKVYNLFVSGNVIFAIPRSGGC